MKIAIQPTPPPTRREFCASACHIASLVAVGGLAGCGPSSPSSTAPPLASVSGTVSGRTVSVTIDGASALANVGSAAILQTSIGTFLIARIAQDSFNVFTAICTHEQCTITGFTNSQFACPCHGSRYTTGGAVANGPAPRALQQFPSQFSGTVLTFTG